MALKMLIVVFWVIHIALQKITDVSEENITSFTLEVKVLLPDKHG
jgi:hypothetical protein